MALALKKPVKGDFGSKKYTVRDYNALPEGRRAELINGRFYDLASPSTSHQLLLIELCFEIRAYIKAKGGPCKVLPAPFSVKLFPEDEHTVVEPDISVICDPAKINERGCIGAPDWIIEIASPSTAKRDYLRKLYLYRKAGVREYWIVNPMNQGIIVYRMDGDDFDTMTYDFQDRVKAGIYEDLWIDFKGVAEGALTSV